MKKIPLPTSHWQHLLLLIVCFASMSKVHAQYYDFMADNEGTTIYYRIEGKNAVVVRGSNKYAGDVAIPSMVSYAGKDYTVTEIGNFAFDECADLQSIILSPTLEKIGTYAFYKCSSLTSVSIPNNVNTIGSYAFWGCTNIKSIVLPVSLKLIENNTFYDCKNLKSIAIPYGVRRIGNNAFTGCRMLTSVSIPNSVNAIESFAFSDCSTLKTLTLPDQLTSIGEFAFSGCSRLASLVIPNSVTVIEEYAFWNCTGLTSVFIPNSVAFIGDRAFASCDVITTVTTEIEEPFAIGNYVFTRDVKKNATLHVPYGLADRYMNTSGWEFVNIEEESLPNYSLVLWAKDGSMMAVYVLRNNPRITFTPSEVMISSANVDIGCYSLNDFSKFTYEMNVETEAGINNILTEETQFSLNGESIYFPSLKANSTISVYALNGTCVLNKTIQQTGSYALPVSGLQSGMYLLKVNGLTYKILKK